MRLDVCLVERGLAKSRTLASRLIADGSVTVGGKVIKKASFSVSDTDEVAVAESELLRYVSRGGLKLEAALDAFDLDVRDFVCFDFGSSTGGFCDCLLQRGIRKVFAVDVGKSQLDEKIRSDARVVCMEETDARWLSSEVLGEECDLGVMDVSFISQSLLYPAAANCLKENAPFVTLFKPQFEVGRSHVAKGGIVKDVRARETAFETLLTAAKQSGLRFVKRIPSPIPGGDGNYEELLLFLRCADV
ncbi:MAG: TlyA family RNA methyltransferase [Clostridia bacterium]|nr:TlyA family RNA methyltransferase [Clostridia bacterium]